MLDRIVTIIVITQGNFLKYLFSFDINSQNLSRVNGNMVITEDEKINLQEINVDLITIKATAYENNNAVWEKVFLLQIKGEFCFPL